MKSLIDAVVIAILIVLSLVAANVLLSMSR